MVNADNDDDDVMTIIVCKGSVFLGTNKEEMYK
jgi:hypothetical protein